MMPNARHELLLEAGARQKWTLAAVACTPMLDLHIARRELDTLTPIPRRPRHRWAGLGNTGRYADCRPCQPSLLP